ncbi:general secretion pathway protein GspK [Yersinia ruckeri]|uniref:general secretion pathway protein GspK n=1 Tax=Yersinia ruckeri TaxID=29486 RepID=UPI0020BDB632|nr:type II secretion system protein GspK [Yersinia ruckeri]EKN4182350.1 general secretion pathway protein GspK [Yersinia ruckeri]MCK8555318.1 type II secretion system protein GspK [Yersinia ruckeri]
MEVNQSGVALLFVILITSLLSMIALSVKEYWFNVYSLTQLTISLQREKELLLNAENIVLRKIYNHSNDIKLFKDELIILDEKHINVDLYSITECLNLNALLSFTDSTAVKIKEKYYYAAIGKILDDVGIDQYDKKNVLDGINQLTNHAVMRDDANYNIALSSLPLNDSHRFQSNNDILLIPGVTEEVFNKIKEVICILPDDRSLININSLNENHVDFLSAIMLGKIPKDNIVKTVNAIPVNGWESVSDFMGFLLKGTPLEVRKELLSYARMLLSTEYNYIKAGSSLVSDSGQYRLVTLFRLDGKSLNITQRRYEMKGWGNG